MEIEQLRKEINQLLENIVLHSQDFSDGRKIPSLEISVVLGKVNKMQERLIILKHLIDSEEKNKKTIKIQVEPEVIIEETIVSDTPEKNIEPLKENIVIEEEVIDEPAAIVEEETPLTVTNTKEETISNNTVADQIQQSPIAKLVDAFTLNDRYLYANELFNKDMSAFNALIKAIDNCTSADEAQSLFNKTGAAYNWDTENTLVINFMDLIERRFL